MSNVRHLDTLARAQLRGMLDASLDAVAGSKRAAAERLDREVRNHLAEIAVGYDERETVDRIVSVPLSLCRKALTAQRLHDMADEER